MKQQLSAQPLELHDAVVWTVKQVHRFPTPMQLPDNATKKWTPVFQLLLGVAEVKNIFHAVVGVCGAQVAQVKAMRMSEESLKQLLKLGASSLLVTPSAWCHWAGVPKPHEQDGEPGTPMSLAEPPKQRLQCLRRGVAEKQYSVAVILSALRLVWALRSQQATPLPSIVAQAIRLSLEPSQANPIAEQVEGGQIELPGRTMLREAMVKLDVLYSLWQRQFALISKGPSLALLGVSYRRLYWEGWAKPGCNR